MKHYTTQRNFEKYTKAFAGHPQWGQYTIADLRKVFEQVQDKDHWKNPLTATFDLTNETEMDTANALQAAIVFFHGVRTTTNTQGTQATISSPGYSC